MFNGLLRLALLCCLILAFSSSATAQAQLAPLNTVPSARDVIGTPPSQFVWIRNNLQVVRDPVDGDLVFIDDGGRVVGRSAVPGNITVTKIERGPAEIRFIDQGAGRQFVVPLDVRPDQFHEVAITEAAGGRAAAPDLRRVDAKHLVVSVSGVEPIDVRSAHGGELSDAYPIGSDSAGNHYIVAEEIVASKPKLDVRATVEKFNPSGQIVGIANVALGGMDVVPRDFATVTDAGQIRVLFPTPNGVDIRTLVVTPTRPANLKSESEISPLAGGRRLPAGRTIRIETTVEKVDGANKFENESMGRSMRSTAQAPPTARTRATILAAAKAYLTVNWTLKPENWEHHDVNNACDKSQGAFWQRPIHFTPAMIGTVIGPMPYAWGGDDTPDSFLDRLTNHQALAGDVCTCRDSSLNDCVYFPKAAGVDCSGFVSRAWGVTKHGTSDLFDIATRVKINDLKAGDALDWSGHHVRLLVSVDSGPVTVFHVIESATRRDCEGVCEQSYRATQMNQYAPIRFRRVLDQ